MRTGVVVIAMLLAGGCTPLPDAPRAVRQDATVDAAPDQSGVETGSDARSDGAPADVEADTLDSDVPDVMGADGPDGDVPPDRAGDVERVTGSFVSSAVPSTNARVSGGFVWHGDVNNSRIEGWLR